MAMVGVQNILTRDEIELFQSARYISSNEAIWKLLKFPIHERFPCVVHLAVHLENGQRVYFDPEREIPLGRDTTLTGFFLLCQSDAFASTLLYSEAPAYFTWDLNNRSWKRRVRGKDVEGFPGVKKDSALGRVYTINPNNRECFHLRMLLLHVRGPTSFLYLRTVEGKRCDTFREACQLLGLLEDDNQWDYTLTEAATSCSSPQRRNLFAIMLHCCDIANPVQLFEKHKEGFCLDIIHNAQLRNPTYEIQMSERIINECLILIQEKLFTLGGNKLQFYGLPDPQRESTVLEDQHLIFVETSYQINVDEVTRNEEKLLEEQKIAFDAICCSVSNMTGQIFFLDAPGGTGKTFLLDLLLSKVRSNNKVALAVASSGIAATLLEGEKTAHSTFKLPLNLLLEETPICSITKQSARGKLLQNTDLIVWDECTMSHRKAFEALDRSLRDLRNCDSLMGGVTVVLAGDFRQTLPVVKKGHELMN